MTDVGLKSQFELLTHHQAVNALQAGQLVVVPTETVYGLAADATCETAIKAIYKAKQRPTTNPLIVHGASITQLAQWAVMPAEPVMQQLAHAFWPGPLTVVLPAQPHVSPLITAGQHTVAVRIPAQAQTLALIEALGHPIVAPSANPHTRISPTSVQAVQQVFAQQPAEHLQPIAGILQGEQPCQVGIESTIVDLSQWQTHGHWQLLRLGMISEAQLTPILGPSSVGSHQTPVVPGQLHKHYAPIVPTYLMSTAQVLQKADEATQVLVLAYSLPLQQQLPHVLAMPNQPEAYAAALYQQLHHAEQQIVATAELKSLWIECPPNEPAWQAVIDRLQRASA